MQMASTNIVFFSIETTLITKKISLNLFFIFQQIKKKDSLKMEVNKSTQTKETVKF